MHFKCTSILNVIFIAILPTCLPVSLYNLKLKPPVKEIIIAAPTVKPEKEPLSGEDVRLRGGENYNAGRVEVFHRDTWYPVCDKWWDIRDASTVCRQLGFREGALLAPRKSYFGPGLWRFNNRYANNFACSANQTSIRKCKYVIDSICNERSLAGAVCRPNDGCEDGWVAGRNSCYKIYEARSTRRESRQVCRGENSALVQIENNEENNFLSNLLIKIMPDEIIWHTAGVKLQGIWQWKDYDSRVSYTKWFPGWMPNNTLKEPTNLKRDKCIFLQREYSVTNGPSKRVDYTWWNDYFCRFRASFICEKPKINQTFYDCYTKRGTEYRGFVSKTKRGSVCQMWSDSPGYHVNQSVHGLGRHNYCRNPDNDTQPWCWVDIRGDKYGFCDIHVCDKNVKTKSVTNGHVPIVSIMTCRSNQFHCKIDNRCISSNWRCDGEVECRSLEDELDCQYSLPLFSNYSDHELMDSDIWVKYSSTPLERCAQLCVNLKIFVCRSFNYKKDTKSCYLSSKNVPMVGEPRPALNIDYYELKSQSMNCTEMFTCSNGKCIPSKLVCNGDDDCNDFSDEDFCGDHSSVQVRIVDGDEHSGRVEVKYINEWGIVCDDKWDKADADVVCRMLGYSQAVRASSHAEFGYGKGNILLDDVTCTGYEDSLANCSHNGWRKHDCYPYEAAGVECLTSKSCKPDEYYCSTKKCLPARSLCDGTDDCGDGSDEQNCDIRVELIGGRTRREGRVDIIRKGIRGTICDDEWDDRDADVVCRMLGHSYGKAKLGGFFMSGSGLTWLDNVACRGNESSLTECDSQPWTVHDCSHAEDAGVTCYNNISEVIFTQKVKQQINEMLNEFKVCGKLSKMSRLRRSLPLAMVGNERKAYLMRADIANLGDHPWQAGVYVSVLGILTDKPKCGGTILSNMWILSAAHCFVHLYKSSFVIKVGDLNTRLKDKNEQEFEVDLLLTHERYDRNTHDNDIALIKLKRKAGNGIVFSDTVQPACLPRPETEYTVDMTCQISGWGRTEAGYPDTLRAGDVPIHDPNLCQKLYKGELTSGMFCAGSLEGGVDSCQGDSGGPLICNLNGTYTVLGVTSWGFGCSVPGRPGIYSKVQAYLPWIYEKITYYS